MEEPPETWRVSKQPKLELFFPLSDAMAMDTVLRDKLVQTFFVPCYLGWHGHADESWTMDMHGNHHGWHGQ